MAASVVECFSNPELVQEAKQRFKEELGDASFKSLLPTEQKPPLDLNRATMERFRPLMAKHYLTDIPRFS
jgi:aminobenzoyl-glutamate utilization protein B